MSARLQILNDSIERVKGIQFGDPITNICAGDGNPQRLAFFVKYTVKQHKNRFGFVHRYHFVRCTDNKGKFWNTGIQVIYPGHLPYDECKALFEPVWQAQYGNMK